MIQIDDPMYTMLKWNVASAFKQLGFIRVPIDPVELMASAGIQVMPYSIAFDTTNFDDIVMLSGCPSGISFTLQGTNGETRLAAYNNYEPHGRNRFTTAHEAGHCFLGHKCDSPLAERQANFWARYAIAPPALIHHMGLQSGSEVAEHFGLSNECASNAFDAYLKWLRHRSENEDIDGSILELYMKGLLIEERDNKLLIEQQTEVAPMHLRN
ncbi:ImmA/IrrE family metallo-endopeptidase [Bifidobacterium olomucense]|uniref:IrrE N-terminal-like domain-containing protein n=1 Tax=Bifidobacterium olomucense TaxID=2675324 RepID=A0A7Y0EYE2_9BIFI|nr:ImmA/IrrE family metallo-endopeptidase [Bifidobacterium sp. DSM 109959]NMM98695.1 hypothetical protein [Bifidobacterium sp. DSM 109959]